MMLTLNLVMEQAKEWSVSGIWV